MIKTHWTLEQIKSALERLDMGSGVHPSPDVIDMIMYVERLFYNSHIEDIRKRQDRLE